MRTATVYRKLHQTSKFMFQTSHLGVIMLPKIPDFVLAPGIPKANFCIFIHRTFIIKPNSRGCFTRVVPTQLVE